MSGASGSSQPPPSAVLSLDADESGLGDGPSSASTQIVTLISKEGHRLQVARQALMASELCKTTLEGGNARRQHSGKQGPAQRQRAHALFVLLSLTLTLCARSCCSAPSVRSCPFCTPVLLRAYPRVGFCLRSILRAPACFCLRCPLCSPVRPRCPPPPAKDATEIPLYHIEGAIVSKVIDYLTYHMTIPARKIDKPLLSNNMKDLVDKWDVMFIEGENAQAGGAGATQGAAATAAGTMTSAAASAPSSSATAASPPSAATAAVSPASSSSSSGATGAPSAAAQEVLFKLLLAANYLNIRSLLQLTCAKVASLMKGKTPDQIRAVFNIRNDYTQAEEEEVRKEYKDLIG